MRWRGERQSTNVDDRRGMSAGKGLAMGGGAIAVIFLIIKLLIGGDNSAISPMDILQPGGHVQPSAPDLDKPFIL